MTKDDDVATLHVFIRQQVLAEGPRRRVRQLVDDQVIAREQRVVHGRSRNDKRLRDGGGAEQQN